MEINEEFNAVDLNEDALNNDPENEIDNDIEASNSIHPIDDIKDEGNEISSSEDIMSNQNISSIENSPSTSHENEYHNWYMLHTYSGFEMRVEKQINELKRTAQDKGLVHQVLLPTEKVMERGKDGQKKTTVRKLFPGYLMVQMTMTDESWHLVQSIPKVTGFVGGKNRPAPMGSDDVRRILDLVQKGQENPGPRIKYEVGDEVRVIDGHFGGFNGIVENVNPDKGKLKVSVSIFGRLTPVELDFIQVSKG